MKIELVHDTICGVCGGPLMQTDTGAVFDKPTGPRLPVWVHARHRDWAGGPHAAVPWPRELTATLRQAASAVYRQRGRTGRGLRATG